MVNPARERMRYLKSEILKGRKLLDRLNHQIVQDIQANKTYSGLFIKGIGATLPRIQYVKKVLERTYGNSYLVQITSSPNGCQIMLRLKDNK